MHRFYMHKAPTRGHEALSNELPQPNSLVASKIQTEENETIVAFKEKLGHCNKDDYLL